MPITTLKRFQSEREWWHTLEDCNAEIEENPQSGSRLLYYDEFTCKEGKLIFSLDKADTLLLRDALNQLYPPD
jgi:hypothetical protein